jgi:hypothetical protein
VLLIRTSFTWIQRTNWIGSGPGSETLLSILKALTNEKGGGLKVEAFDRSASLHIFSYTSVTIALFENNDSLQIIETWLGLSQDEACTDLFENSSETYRMILLSTHLFSLVNTFKINWHGRMTAYFCIIANDCKVLLFLLLMLAGSLPHVALTKTFCFKIVV